MKIHHNIALAACALVILTPQPTQAQITWEDVLPKSVFEYFGGKPAVKTGSDVPLSLTVKDTIPPCKEVITKKDCEQFGCEVVNGKLVMKDLGKQSYNVTSPKSKYYADIVPPEADMYKNPLVVNTTWGPVRGFYNHGLYRGVNHHIDIFRANTPRGWLGIPFARPPTKHRRFKEPMPFLKPWSPNLRLAHNTPKACPQLGLESYSDDCLYLNVFSPSKERMDLLAKQPDQKKLPVMVYIYGGGFNLGSAYMYSLYDGRYLTKTHDALVVTFNHRVAAFGFFVGGEGDKRAKGNMAIQDQTMALQWIKQNIANFGGDPENITIVGLSSGATSVLAHMISPKTDASLFQKAIIMSAPHGQYSRTIEEMEKVSMDYARQLGCTKFVGKIEKVDMDCMNTKPIKELAKLGSAEPDQFAPELKGTKRLMGTHYYWWPHVDGEVIPQEPIDMVLAGNFKRVPTIMGVAREEMGYFNKFIPQTDWIAKLLGSRKIFTQDVMTTQLTDLFGAANFEILRKYYPIVADEKANEMSSVMLTTDVMFKCPMVSMADLLARENSQVYVYELIQPADYIPLGRCSIDMSCHAFDIPYLFNPSFVWLSDREVKLSKHYTTYFMDFMAGNINKRVTAEFPGHTPWPVYSKEKKEYMNIAPDPAVGHALRKDHCAEVWAKIGYKF